MGDRIAILREGGTLAQYDTPDAILAHPADEFVERFIGEDRALRRLGLRRVGDIPLGPVQEQSADGARAAATATVRTAGSVMLEAGTGEVLVVGDDGAPAGLLTLEAATTLLRP